MHAREASASFAHGARTSGGLHVPAPFEFAPGLSQAGNPAGVLNFKRREEKMRGRKRKPPTPNPVAHGLDGVSILTLSCKGEAMECFVDTQNYPLVQGRHWHGRRIGSSFYAETNSYKPDGKRTKIFMHAVLLPDAEMRKHKDGNGLNNRRANLCAVTRSENSASAKRRRGSMSSRFRGVSRVRSGGKWRAYVAVAGKGVYLGSFQLEVDAALAYDRAAKEYFGDFASLNFPKESQSKTFATRA
jgi:hypothetical protein